MKKFFQILGPQTRGFFWALIVGLLFCGACILAPTLSGRLVNAVMAGDSQSGLLLIGFLALGAAQAGLSLADFHASDSFKLRLKAHLRREAYQAFSRQDSAGQEALSGFSSFVNNDIPSLAEQHFAGLIDILKTGSMLVMSAASLLYVHWAMALVVVSVSLLIVFLPKLLGEKDAAARQAFSQSLGRYNTVLQSFLGGLRVLKAYCCQRRSFQLLEEENQQVQAAERALLGRRLLIYAIQAVLQVAKTILIFAVGLWLVSQKAITIGGLIAIIQLAELIASPSEVLSYLFHAKNEVRPLLTRYQELTAPLPAQQAGAEPGPFQELAVEHLSYQAGGIHILRDVTVTFAAGKKYLITGESGSGKSTLLRLLARLGDRGYTGQIRLGGVDIRAVGEGAFFSQVCPVFQEPYLFFASLEENICLGRPVPPQRLAEIISKLNLDYLLQRYQGQEITPEVVERLSGGEKQRVALARAMVGRPALYLLDEITSALDSENARTIESALLEEPAAVVHVSHRPGQAEHYHVRLALEAGQLRALP